MRVLFALVLFTACFAQEVADPKQREKDAKALANDGASALPTLRPMLEDPAVRVRRAAVQSIIAIGGQHSLQPLTFSLKDGDPEVQRLAIDGLVNFYLPGYYESGWKGRVKRTASQVIDRFGDREEPVVPAYVTASPEIIQGIGEIAASSADMETRATAVRALGVLRARPASDQLLAALATKNTEVLYEVMIAFEKMRNREVAPKLFYLLRDPDEKVQIAAIQTVSVLGNEEANEHLREAWSRTRNTRVRRALLEAMAMLPAEENRPLLEEHLRHRDEYLRAAAAEGLGRLGKAEDRARLEALWESESKMRPRLALAFAVVALGRHEVAELSPLQYLIDTLNSRSWHGVAEGFLKDLALDSAVRYTLHNALYQGTRDEKLALAGILGERGAKDSVPVLETLARDADAEVATESSKALRTLRTRLQ